MGKLDNIERVKKEIRGGKIRVKDIPFGYIYALWCGKEIVYIGKTLNMRVRLKEHTYGECGTSRKVFDRYSIIKTKREKMRRSEELLIRWLTPKYNNVGSIPYLEINKDIERVLEKADITQVAKGNAPSITTIKVIEQLKDLGKWEGPSAMEFIAGQHLKGDETEALAKKMGTGVENIRNILRNYGVSQRERNRRRVMRALQEYEGGGMTLEESALKNGVSLGTLEYWRYEKDLGSEKEKDERERDAVLGWVKGHLPQNELSEEHGVPLKRLEKIAESPRGMGDDSIERQLKENAEEAFELEQCLRDGITLEESAFVYGLYSEDGLIYIGRTKDLKGRMDRHHLKGEFETITFSEVSSSNASHIEARLIKELVPPLNKHVARTYKKEFMEEVARRYEGSLNIGAILSEFQISIERLDEIIQSERPTLITPGEVLLEERGDKGWSLRYKARELQTDRGALSRTLVKASTA